jgi:hypothetical protein
MTDNRVRGALAMVISAAKTPDGRVEVVFDDARLEAQGSGALRWRHHNFVTITTLDEEKFLDSAFPPEELQNLGAMVLTSLRVLYRSSRRREQKRGDDVE